MQLNEIFAKDVERPIEGVIKADDVAHLGTEVEEYVLTNEAAKGAGAAAGGVHQLHERERRLDLRLLRLR